MIFDETYTLGNGIKLPKLALGTWLMENDEAAQLCIKYDLQLGLTVLPKTSNPDHMRSNAQMDFVISDEDMKKLMNLEHIKDYGESSCFLVYGGKM